MALGTKEGARRGPDPTLVSSEGACGPLRLKPCATPCLANPWIGGRTLVVTAGFEVPFPAEGQAHRDLLGQA